MSEILTQLSINIARSVLPINIFLGITGNLANIFVLTQPNLIKYASSHFFLAMAVNNLLGAGLFSTNDMLSIGYKIDLINTSLVWCRIIRYTSDLCALLCSYFIVLASVDRYCASSSSANRRRWSSVKMARFMIISLVIFFGLIYINTLVLTELDRADRLGCSIRSRTAYHKFFTIFQVVIYTILAPGLMILFGMLTIYNTKKIQIQPRRILTRRRTERQLTWMLLVQVLIHALLNLPISILYLMTQFLPPRLMTAQFYFALMMARYLCQFSYSSPFFLYIITGRTFRRELISLINRRCHRTVINQVHPLRSDIDLTPGHYTISTAPCKKLPNDSSL